MASVTVTEFPLLLSEAELKTDVLPTSAGRSSGEDRPEALYSYSYAFFFLVFQVLLILPQK